MTTATELPPLMSLVALREYTEAQGMPTPSLTTFRNWTTVGVLGVKLRTHAIGGLVFTSLAWFEQFSLEVQQARVSRRSK